MEPSDGPSRSPMASMCYSWSSLAFVLSICQRPIDCQ